MSEIHPPKEPYPLWDVESCPNENPFATPKTPLVIPDEEAGCPKIVICLIYGFVFVPLAVFIYTLILHLT